MLILSLGQVLERYGHKVCYETSLMFLVGTYTQNDSEGLYLLALNPHSNKLRNLDAIAKGTNQSLLALSKDETQLFAVTGEQSTSISRLEYHLASDKFDLIQVLAGGTCVNSTSQLATDWKL